MTTQSDSPIAQTQPDRNRDWRLRRLTGLIWLVGLAVPVSNLLGQHPAAVRLALSVVGVALFVVLFARVIMIRPFSRLQFAPAGDAGVVSVAILAALSIGLILLNGSSWLDMLVYTTVYTGVMLPERQAVRVVVSLSVVSFALTRLYGLDWNNTLGTVLITLGGGFVTIGYGRLITTVNELRAAREEIARLAVAEERLRFGRDLHDLLGHSLSLIALKSELAVRLSAVAPERAASEIKDVEGVARQALQEMRDAVAAYRQPTLASELSAANELLAAAGIAYTFVGNTASDTGLLPAGEATLAWAVREGVTNVIRHSRARHCTIRLAREPGSVQLDVCDDGRGAPAEILPATPGQRHGSGLAGLRERVAALDGSCEAGPRAVEDNGGFRLAVSLPLAAASPRGETAMPATEGATVREAQVAR